ncbi:hypothetical protein DPEC_G00018950 [Dallia pectoralis]|uniref:Uncharacterized protein n=1 Tax=Dallia pectoralis TaxID=75939 RepID=A0ACC2HFV3_DALPE|nr:hypothetical protein DPEC_G00018950 [Dallia pectoralis]
MSTINQLFISGPGGIRDYTGSAGLRVITWKPTRYEADATHTICFMAQAYKGSNKYQSEFRCVIVNVAPYDYCQSPVCGPNADCYNSRGLGPYEWKYGYRCTCQPGYKVPSAVLQKAPSALSPSQPCEDIDECNEDLNICGPNAGCYNTIGSYTCASDEDIDECSLHSSLCGLHANCYNNIDGYICSCQSGYKAPPGVAYPSSTQPCEDIDECGQDSICGSHSTCYNTIGSYICSSDEDIDECSFDSSLCGPNAYCYNTIEGHFVTIIMAKTQRNVYDAAFKLKAIELAVGKGNERTFETDSSVRN